MGNKVSAVRYPWAIQIADPNIAGIICPELTEGIVLSVITTLSSDQLLAAISFGLSAPTSTKPIDFGKFSIIRVLNKTGGGYWDVSFEDPRALSKFSYEISRELLRTAGGQTPEEEKETIALMKKFETQVVLEQLQKMAQVPATTPKVRR